MRALNCWRKARWPSFHNRAITHGYVGTASVWGPLGIWLLLTDHVWRGVILLAWGTLFVHPTDNVLRPLLISNAARVPFFLIMLRAWVDWWPMDWLASSSALYYWAPRWPSGANGRAMRGPQRDDAVNLGIVTKETYRTVGCAVRERTG